MPHLCNRCTYVDMKCVILILGRGILRDVVHHSQWESGLMRFCSGVEMQYAPCHDMSQLRYLCEIAISLKTQCCIDIFCHHTRVPPLLTTTDIEYHCLIKYAFVTLRRCYPDVAARYTKDCILEMLGQQTESATTTVQQGELMHALPFSNSGSRRPCIQQPLPERRHTIIPATVGPDACAPIRATRSSALLSAVVREMNGTAISSWFVSHIHTSGWTSVFTVVPMFPRTFGLMIISSAESVSSVVISNTNVFSSCSLYAWCYCTLIKFGRSCGGVRHYEYYCSNDKLESYMRGCFNAIYMYDNLVFPSTTGMLQSMIVGLCHKQLLHVDLCEFVHSLIDVNQMLCVSVCRFLFTCRIDIPTDDLANHLYTSTCDISRQHVGVQTTKLYTPGNGSTDARVVGWSYCGHDDMNAPIGSKYGCKENGKPMYLISNHNDTPDEI